MNSFHKRILTAIGATALACSILPLAASAQGAPSYAQPGTETITGTIAAVNGKYNIAVHDQRGFVDNVTLHDGTIINPTGLTLAPGESVMIEGVAEGPTFVANEINTPYTSYAAYPYGVYPGYYPYPVYGPTVGIGLHFGGGFGFRRR